MVDNRFYFNKIGNIMKFEITMLIEGDEQTKHDLDNGNIQNGIAQDVLDNEDLLNFVFKQVE